jgi:glycosyltransferase involved in cell wall biosynthesis
MKIVIAHKFYRPVGGTEEFVRQLTSLLEDHGHTVIPFGMHHPDNWPTPYERYFVPSIDYRAELGGRDRLARAFGAIPRVLYWPEARRRFDALLRDVQPDVVHIQSIAHQISPSILYAAKARGIPIIQTVNDYKLICPATGLLNGRTNATCTKCLDGSYWHATVDRCQDHSQAASAMVTAEMYLHHRILKVYERTVGTFLVENETRRRLLVRGGVPADRIRVLPQPFDSSAYSPIPFAGDRFLYFGRLDPDKGVELLIEAAGIAGVNVDIVGSGTESDRLAELADQYAPGLVTFHGPVYGRDLEPLVAHCLATVLPSRQMEGTPYAVLQSFAWGRGVIASDVGALPEIVRHGSSGLVVRAGQVAELASGLSDLRSDPAAARSFGTAAREQVLIENAPEHYYDLLIGVYTAAAARAS